MTEEEGVALSDPEDEDLEDAAVVSNGVGASDRSKQQEPVHSGASPPGSDASAHEIPGAHPSEKAVSSREKVGSRAGASDNAQSDGPALVAASPTAAAAAQKQRELEAAAEKKKELEAAARMSGLEQTLKRVQAQLEVEKEARSAAESSKAESDRNFVRVKAAAKEAVRQRDEARRLAEEAAKQKDAALAAQQRVQEQMEQRSVQIAIEVSELEAKIARLKEESSKAGEAAGQKEARAVELEGACRRWEEEARRERRGREQVEDQVRGLEAEVTKWRRDADEQQKGMRNMKEALLQMDKKIHEAQSRLKEAEASSARWEGEARAEKQGREKETALRTKVVEKLQDALMQAEGARQELHAEQGKTKEQGARLEELESAMRKMKVETTEEIAALMKEAAAKDAELARLQGALKDVAGSKGVIGALETALEAEREARTKAEQAQRNAEGALALEKGALEEAERGRVEALAQVESLQERVGELELEVARLQGALEAALAESQDKTDRIGELEERALQAEGTVQQLNERLEEAAAEADSLRAGSERDAAAAAQALEEAERSAKQVSNLNLLVSQWRRQAEDALAKIASKEEMAAAAVAAQAAAESSLRMADSRAAEMRRKVEEMAERLDDLEMGLERREADGLGLGGLSLGSWGVGSWRDCWPRLGFGRGGRQRGAFDDAEGVDGSEEGHLMEPLI